jgi:hypothetical protein
VILLEILTGAPAFPESLHPYQIERMIYFREERAEIPDSIPPSLKRLIQD